MDGTAVRDGQGVDVGARIDEIRNEMPETYAAIKRKADQIGNLAYQLVRAGIRGQANSFYAIERGFVVGTPFDLPNVEPELARVMVQFGCRSLIMWGPQAQKVVTDGTH